MVVPGFSGSALLNSVCTSLDEGLSASLEPNLVCSFLYKESIGPGNVGKANHEPQNQALLRLHRSLVSQRGRSPLRLGATELSSQPTNTNEHRRAIWRRVLPKRGPP
jgi:hypothetical protein